MVTSKEQTLMSTNCNWQVAMTYSVELFICMVVGLVAGHAFFNSGP